MAEHFPFPAINIGRWVKGNHEVTMDILIGDIRHHLVNCRTPVVITMEGSDLSFRLGIQLTKNCRGRYLALRGSEAANREKIRMWTGYPIITGV